MSIEELLGEEDTFEARIAAEERLQAGRLVYLLAPNRVHMEPQLRQAVGYMLDHDDWLVDPISLMVITPDGTLAARLSYGGVHRTAWQQFLAGPPQPRVHQILPYCEADYLVRRLREACERAELDAEDTDWLMKLPRVVDKRPEFASSEDGQEE